MGELRVEVQGGGERKEALGNPGERWICPLRLQEAVSSRKPNYRYLYKKTMIFLHPKVRGKQLLELVHGLPSRQVPLGFSPSCLTLLSRLPSLQPSAPAPCRGGEGQVWPHSRTSALSHWPWLCHVPPCAERRPGMGAVVRVCEPTRLQYPFSGFCLPIHGGSYIFTAGRMVV